MVRGSGEVADEGMSVEQIEAVLRNAREREREAAKRRKAETPIRRRFTVTPAQDTRKELYDDTCLFYEITGDVANRAEALEAGHSDLDLRGGGMVYVYNTATHRIICAAGGGTIWFSSGWGNKKDDATAYAMELIGNFIAAHPEGGDITWIYSAYNCEHVGLFAGDDPRPICSHCGRAALREEL